MERYDAEEVEAKPLMAVKKRGFIPEKERASVRIKGLEDRKEYDRKDKGKQPISEFCDMVL
jgi:hypothetical protein